MFVIFPFEQTNTSIGWKRISDGIHFGMDAHLITIFEVVFDSNLHIHNNIYLRASRGFQDSFKYMSACFLKAVLYQEIYRW